jgi:two-component sensor histidine kinase
MSDAAPPVALAEMLRLLRGASVTIFSQDSHLRYRWLQNPPATWSAATVVRGRTDSDFLPAGAAAAATAAKREVLLTGRPHWAEFVVEASHSRQYFELYVEPERDAAGVVSGVIGLALDVTERRKRVAALEAIVRQAAHRSKNLLAILQSIAVQTAREASSTNDFIEKYRSRIQSISRSQDIALGPSSHGTRLPDLVAAQVEPYVTNAAKRVEFEGEDCELTANAALHIGLALSELAVLAVNKGALSGADGGITITAEKAVDPTIDAALPSLRVVWREHASQKAALPEGFTLQLLERLIPSALSGHSELTVDERGLRYALVVGPGEFQ